MGVEEAAVVEVIGKVSAVVKADVIVFRNFFRIRFIYYFKVQEHKLRNINGLPAFWLGNDTQKLGRWRSSRRICRSCRSSSKTITIIIFTSLAVFLLENFQ